VKYAVISDLHANWEALTAVLAHIDAAGVDRIVCLGDVVGYYANPNECLQLIQERGITCLAGNHDRVAVGAKEPVRFGQAGKKAILWTREKMTPEACQLLANLPVSQIIDEHILLVHASLHPEPNEEIYLTSDKHAHNNFQVLQANFPDIEVCFFGHTHRRTAYQFHNSAVTRIYDEELKLLPGARYLINPGSVGRSRDRDARAGYLTYDRAAQTVNFHRVDFDLAACTRKAEEAGITYQESLLSRAENMVTGVLELGQDLLRRRRAAR
jgi:predicted phosphodiesterase